MNRYLSAARALIPDALMLLGMGCISYGAAQVYVPAGWIVAGAFAFAFGLLLARRAGEA